MGGARGPRGVAERPGTGPRGLSVEEARARLADHGPNELEEVPPPSSLVILAHQFKSPLIYMLVVATLVTIALDAVIGFTQERRAEASVRALMQLLTPHAHVHRDGRDWDMESASSYPATWCCSNRVRASR